ncbi:hypothetical protein BDF20DRAFT_857701 [Mycotypha africana]|uniref:uncharacterized protein n=1 Tax=Mycotypha africana TaxID=64632 RepID=UPI0023005282|nr:uncharacterized protein BDF20DRAFT_857701 [Mycotypha africana]KAI8984048.1 hypothetical protein BDF20DRAFT_857701 [Mycotypha africana]
METNLTDNDDTQPQPSRQQQQIQATGQQQQQRQQINRSSFYMLLFLFSLLFFNFTDESSMRAGKQTKAELMEDLQKEVDSLNNMTFGVNVTHPIPPTVEDTLKHDLWSLRQQPEGVYYHNITGVFRGEWENRNLSIPDTLNKTELDEARKTFDFAGPGSFSVNFKTSKTRESEMNYMEGYIRMKDAEKSNYGTLLLAGGVQFINNGSIFMIVVPEGQSLPLKQLLHMLPNNETFVMARNVINEQIEKRIEELKSNRIWDWQTVDDSDQSVDLSMNCTFQLFGQLSPLPTTYNQSDLLDFEDELEDPQGISIIHPPAPSLSVELYSPNCQLLLLSEKEKGIKIESYYNKAVTYAGVASVIAVIQIFTLIHQMECTPTPSSVSNVSYWTIAMQAIMDGYLCLLHLTTGVVIENVFIPFATAAFFTFVLVSIFGMRYLLVVWRIQRPESVRANSRPTTPPRTAAQRENGYNSDSDEDDSRNSLPGTQPQRPTNTTTTTTTTEDTDNPQRETTYLYYRLYAVMLLGLFLFYQSITRSAFVQNIIIGTLGFILYSFWIPQIARNVIRGCRRPLSHRYIIVMSVTRLCLPLYFYGYSDNLIAHETTPWVWAFVLYVAIQVLILFLQDTFGPRFFVPSRYMPHTYDYHPILTTDDEEAEQGVGGGSSSNETPSSKDCAICMLPIDFSQNGHSSLNVLARTHYMVTPCHHMFHTECLEKVNDISLETRKVEPTAKTAVCFSIL